MVFWLSRRCGRLFVIHINFFWVSALPLLGNIFPKVPANHLSKANGANTRCFTKIAPDPQHHNLLRVLQTFFYRQHQQNHRRQRSYTTVANCNGTI